MEINDQEAKKLAAFWDQVREVGLKLKGQQTISSGSGKLVRLYYADSDGEYHGSFLFSAGGSKNGWARAAVYRLPTTKTNLFFRAWHQSGLDPNSLETSGEYVVEVPGPIPDLPNQPADHNGSYYICMR